MLAFEFAQRASKRNPKIHDRKSFDTEHRRTGLVKRSFAATVVQFPLVARSLFGTFAVTNVHHFGRSRPRRPSLVQEFTGIGIHEERTSLGVDNPEACGIAYTTIKPKEHSLRLD